MNRFARYLLISFTLYITGILTAQAATYSASSCSDSAIQSAINSASNGDTVLVPAGNCTWTGAVVIPRTKGITLQGAGIGSTNITGGRIDLYTKMGNAPSRITGFSFTWYSSVSDTTAFIRVEPGYANDGANNWRIDNNSFTYTGNNYGSAGVWIYAYSFGLIDNNIFRATPRGVMIEAISVNDAVYNGDYSWSQTPDIGTPARGGYPNSVYIEDNTFTDIKFEGDQAVEGQYGSRYVFRYNKLYGYHADTHAGCSMNGRNPHVAEIYHNEFYDGRLDFFRAIWLRSVGTAIVFSNIVSGNGYLVLAHISQEESCQSCNGPYSAISRTTYPMINNVGRAGPNNTLAPYYAWSNTLHGNPAGIVFNKDSTVYCTATANMIQENRDFYNISAGTSLPATCNPKQGYFKTNEGKQGTLYQCTDTNVWTAYYTPYSYPHPLRNQSSSTNENPSNSDQLVAPTKLRIVNQ